MKNPLPASVVRVATALLVSAVLFQSGREVGRLEGQAAGPSARRDPGNELVSATYRTDPEPAKEAAPVAAPGDPLGESGGDIITPLNVRDPSALVMGPGGHSCLQGSPELPPVPPPVFKPDAEPAPRRAKPLREGRLLELLRKQGDLKDKETPKAY